MHDCLICTRIERIKHGQNPFFVKELRTGYVVIGDTQLQQGYTLFLSKLHRRELHELQAGDKLTFLSEMARVAEAVHKAFNPNKLNYELLGNGDEHLHWHIIPRYKDEEYARKTYWSLPKEERNNKKYTPNPAQINELKARLYPYL